MRCSYPFHILRWNWNDLKSVYLGFGGKLPVVDGGFFARRGTSLVHHHLNLLIDYKQKNLPECVRDHIPNGNQHSSSGSQKLIFVATAVIIITVATFSTLPLGTPCQARWLPDLKHFSSRAKESQDEYLVGKYIPVLVGEALP